MKIRHKKILLSGVAVTVAGILGVGALLETSISVQASSAMMPGIEEIVNETSKDEPFRILEIVDSEDEAEIGYYVSGQEPYIKLYRDENGNLMNFSSLEDGLSKLPEKERREFATNKKTDENGNVSYTGRNVESLCGDSESDYPLAYSDYQEQYFVSSEEGWNKVDFVDADGNSRTDIVKIEGHYQENFSGTGDYTKQEQTYYPIRKDVAEDNAKTNKYRENIENFYYSDDEEAQAPYALTFAEVKNEDVNKALEDANDKGQVTILPEYDYSNGKYGYYENVYTDLTEDIVNNIQNKRFKFPGENPTVDESKALLVQDNTPQGASAFSAGAEEEFSTANDGDTTADAVQQSDFGSDVSESSSADEFSAGDFGDGNSAGDIQTQANTPQVTDSNAVQTDNANADDQSSKGRTILIGFKNEETKGTVENPYIYLGENIQTYPYYKYTLVGDLENIRTIAQANQQKDAQSVADNTEIVRNEKDITLEDGQYWYWKTDSASNQLAKYPLSIVTGRQAVPYSDIKKIDSSLDYNYYYTVEKAYFCCKSSTDNPQLPTDYQYYGWYYSSYPQNDENTYLKIIDGDGKVATHYISDAEYKLTTGTGDYDFVPNEGEQEQTIEVNHMYYQGGYVNHDWFKRYVFHLSPDDNDEAVRNQFENFNIVVDTITADQFNEKYGNGIAAASAESTDTAAVTTESTSATDGSESDSEINSDGLETSEVEPMVSEAGVELVSIEKEISDNSDDADEFQDGTDTVSNEETSFSDGTDNSISTFSVGDTSDTTSDELSQYGLIYINGAVTAKAVQSIGNIPVMLNSVKVSGNNELLDAFSSVVNTGDSDGHYVNTYVYFFKNMFSADDQSGLINRDFHTNFNSDADGSTFTDTNAKEGFEEILDYIESENQYRQIGDTVYTVQELSDGEDLSSGESSFSADTSDSRLLSKELTQARAIEYIINYKYKRKLNTKSTFNVLEIEPAKTTSTSVNQNSIATWIKSDTGNFIKSYDVCCAYTKTGSDYAPKENIFDGDQSTIWHSDWATYANGHPNGEKHYIEVTFNKKMTLTGFNYLPRTGSGDGTMNGKIREFEFHLYSDEKCENEIYKEDGSFEYDSAKGGIRSDSGLKTFRFANKDQVSNVKSIKIVILSAGDNKVTGNSSTKYASCAELSFSTPDSYTPSQINITQKTSSEYVGHIDDISAEYDMIYIGDKVQDRNRDRYTVGDGEYRYVHVGAGTLATSGTTELLKLLGQLDNEYDNSWTGSNGMQRFAPFSTYSEQGGGYFRGSGNDITEQDYEELMNFVKSGYPVVFGSALITNDRKVDTSKVDAASYYYQFMQEALKYPNVMTETELNAGQKSIAFWINLAKPVINFDENGGKPVEPVRKGEVDDGSGNYGFIDGELKFTFTISNDSDASPATTTYDCNLYLDLNFDGNFSSKEIQDKYMQITDENGTVLSSVTDENGDSRYELKAGKKYTLIRKIPKDYFKLITWKLEISNNQNSYIHTSETGYSKQTNTGKKQEINVLQLVPKNCTWTLSGNTKFQNWMNQVDDFQINMTGISVSDFGKMTQEQVKNLLNTKQMLIIGFADVYDNIDNTNHAVDEILDFVKAGKSILFAHDTTSYINYDYDKMYKKIANSSYTGNVNTEDGASVYWDDYLHRGNINNVTWGLSLNKILRSVVGMDRYGITSDDAIGNVTVSELIKSGNALSSSSVDFKTLMEVAGDIAYQSGDRTKSYGQTQAYTNHLLKSRKLGTNGTTTTTAKKINDGAITQYPYRIPDTLSVANTHGQYYQLALERDRDLSGQSDGKSDIVVWYCLSGSIYDESPNDVRNNYYFYSNKNVIYTGAGHSTVDGDDEIKLFINAIVAAANVTAVQPEVNFVKSLNPAAQTESTRYYMTDQESWISKESHNTLEKNMDLYFNVKDYNMVSADLNPEDLKKQEMTVELYIDNPSGEELSGDNIPADLKGKRVTNLTGLVSGLKAYGNEDTLITIGDDNKFHLKQNNAYGFSISEIENYLRNTQNSGYYTNCKVYVVINSTVYLYGEKKSEVSWSSIDLKQRQLFELD